ncbi:hypothetical protein LY16_03587 [Xenorhabdus doucetiae]|uniref:Uncharacterized protein n=1 Tax=Xenorhabdus doucetiae TaxID=351671 RepID=A0ABY3NLW1_9GAMM|nr:hypothetical protein LY16_03587 [Xenorhabdus doucetiae]
MPGPVPGLRVGSSRIGQGAPLSVKSVAVLTATEGSFNLVLLDSI